MNRVVNRGWKRVLGSIHKGCEQLSQEQRRMILWSVCGIYLLLSLYMLIQPFIVKNSWQPIVVARDTIIKTPVEEILLDSLLMIGSMEYLADK